MALRGRIAVTALVLLVAIPVVLHHRKTGNGMTLQSIDDVRRTAQRNHKFLMVEFGATWCSDCRELAQQMQVEKTRTDLKQHLILINIDVGEFNRNLTIAHALGVDVKQGIPAAVFFEPNGAQSSPRVGNRQILEYLRRVNE